MKLPSNHRLSIRLYIGNRRSRTTPPRTALFSCSSCNVIINVPTSPAESADVTCRICRESFDSPRPALGSCKARFYGVPAPLVVAARGQPSAKPKGNVLAVLNLNNGGAF